MARIIVSVSLVSLLLTLPLGADQGARECQSYPTNKNYESGRFPLNGINWLTKNYFGIHHTATRLAVAVTIHFPDSGNAPDFGHSSTPANAPYRARVKVTRIGGSTTTSDWAYLSTPPTRQGDSTHFVLNGTFPVGSYYATVEVENPAGTEIWTNKVWTSTLLADAVDSTHETAAFQNRIISDSVWTTLATVSTAARPVGVSRNYIIVSNARIRLGDNVLFRLVRGASDVLMTDNLAGVAGGHRHINLNTIHTDPPSPTTGVPASTIKLQAKSASGSISLADGGFLHLMEVSGEWYKLSSSTCTGSGIPSNWTWSTVCQSPPAHFSSPVGVSAYGVGSWNVAGSPGETEVEICTVLRRSPGGERQVEIGCNPVTADGSANEVFAHQNDLVRYGLPSGFDYRLDIEARGLCAEPGQSFSFTSGRFDVIFPPVDGHVNTLAEVCNDSWYRNCAYTCDWNDSLFQLAVNTNDRCSGGPTDPPLNCAGLIQEAENGLLTGFNVFSDGGASGGRYIEVPNGVGNQLGGPNEAYKASYCFDVPATDVYRIKGIVRSPTFQDDSFYIRIDGAPGIGYYWDLPVGPSFAEDYVSDYNTAQDPVEVALTAGTHTIDVFQREDGSGLDRLEMEPAPCGALAQEAEDGVLTGFSVANDGNASGGQYIQVPNGVGNQLNGPNNNYKASYCVTIDDPGTYWIRARIRTPTSQDDSFYVRVDGAPGGYGYFWDVRIASSFTDDYVNNFNNPAQDPVQVFLTAGDHVVDIFQREDGAQLDRIELERH